jgi:hypothetical protein
MIADLAQWSTDLLEEEIIKVVANLVCGKRLGK